MEQNKINSYDKNNGKKDEIGNNNYFGKKDKNTDIINVVGKINNCFIQIFHTKKRLKLKSFSLKKILSLIEFENNLSDIYSDFITFYIINYNKNKRNQELTDDNNELDEKYIKILDRTNIFHINLEKAENKMNEKDFDNKITIHRKSLMKIFSYIKESIISMSDYIFIIIISFKEEEEDEEKIKSNIEKNNVIKQFNTNIEIPVKNQDYCIYKYDILFTNILNRIDDLENESSFSDDIINIAFPKKNIDTEIIKNNSPFIGEEGILTDVDFKEKDNNDKLKNININSKNNFCNEICFVF